jgi:hypothetical protein
MFTIGSHEKQDKFIIGNAEQSLRYIFLKEKVNIQKKTFL